MTERGKNILISGPTVRGTFFIRDTNYRVWDGRSWRGFGAAKDYQTFGAAFSARAKMLRSRAHGETTRRKTTCRE